MLLDHIAWLLIYPRYMDVCTVDGAAMLREAQMLYTLYHVFRIIGRLAFPIYCFLLVEGAHHTQNSRKYGLRLLIGALLAQIPYDLAISGGVDFSRCSVMVTLLLGFCAVHVMRKLEGISRVMVVGLMWLLAEMLETDYAGTGIAIIVLFELTRNLPRRALWQLAGLIVLCWSGHSVQLGPIGVPIQAFAVFAMVPICLYSGEKMTRSKTVQWGFYLFYPAHLLILWAVGAVWMGRTAVVQF
jgi:hypothetical protein